MDNFQIKIDVLPDKQALSSGKLLNGLLKFLKEYRNLKWFKENKKNLLSDWEIKEWVKYFYDLLKPEDAACAREIKEYINEVPYFTVPIEINLTEGEYGINHLVILYTKADLSIVGVEDKTIIKLYRFDFQAEESYLYRSYWNQLICFKAPKNGLPSRTLRLVTP